MPAAVGLTPTVQRGQKTVLAELALEVGLEHRRAGLLRQAPLELALEPRAGLVLPVEQVFGRLKQVVRTRSRF